MDKGSVTDAAQSLNVTQPAVSKVLAQLELAVGFSLFARLHGRLHPTSDARLLYAEATSLFCQVAFYEERVMGLCQGLEGNLTISAIPTLANSIVALTIARFTHERPNVRIQLFSEIAGRVVDDVVHHRADLGFAHHALSTPTIEEQLMGESEMLCMLRRDHPLAAHARLTPILLKDQPLIFLDRWAPPSHLVRECFARANVQPNVVVEANLAAAAKTMAKVGDAIAIIDPWPMIVDPSPDLVMRPFRPRVPLRIMCLHSLHRPMSRAALHFVENLRYEMAQTANAHQFIKTDQTTLADADISAITPLLEIG